VKKKGEFALFFLRTPHDPLFFFPFSMANRLPSHFFFPTPSPRWPWHHTHSSSGRPSFPFFFSLWGALGDHVDGVCRWRAHDLAWSELHTFSLLFSVLKSTKTRPPGIVFPAHGPFPSTRPKVPPPGQHRPPREVRARPHPPPPPPPPGSPNRTATTTPPRPLPLF